MRIVRTPRRPRRRLDPQDAESATHAGETTGSRTADDTVCTRTLRFMAAQWTRRAAITIAVVGLLGGLLAGLCVIVGGLALWIGPVVGFALVAGLIGPPAYSLLWLRLPGSALLTGGVAGIVVGAIWPVAWVGFLGTLVVGALVETLYLVTKYRCWNAVLAGASGALGGLGAGIVAAAPWSGDPPMTALLLPGIAGVGLGLLIHALNATRWARRSDRAMRATS